jgi:uncharacterized membrane-anchored protein
MEDYYTAEDEELIEIQAAREGIDTALELDGQAVIMALMFNGFDR